MDFVKPGFRLAPVFPRNKKTIATAKSQWLVVVEEGIEPFYIDFNQF